jgi:hypothetical protein
MPRRPEWSVPALVHHKPSNRARVRIDGRDHWLGKWRSPEARLAYERLIAEYLANGRITPPQPTAAPVEVVVQPTRPGVDVKSGYSTTEPPAPTTLSVAEVTIHRHARSRTVHHVALGRSGKRGDRLRPPSPALEPHRHAERRRRAPRPSNPTPAPRSQ